MITVEHLTKCYGDFTAVKDLSFEIGEGHVYGFLGPNGAGKSTTMNIMTGCLSPTEGHVTIDGYDILEEPDKAKRLIGYLPEQPPLYLNETPEEYLRFVGEAKGLKGEQLKAQIEEVLEQTKITDVRNRRIAALSKGYKQRVGIAQALLGNPKVIILDEPTVGLDPIQIIEIRDLIKQLGQTHTVILSSHILAEVQTICEKILIIAKGTLVAFDEPEKLENQLMAPNEILFTTEAGADETREILATVAEELVSRFPEDLKKSEKKNDAGHDRDLEEAAPEAADEDTAAGVGETFEDETTAVVAEAPDNSVLGGGMLCDISVEEKEDGLTGVHLKTQHDNIYDVSKAIFFAFAGRQKALLEMSLKKANLEDIFIELTKEDEQS
jgi:ABC-2 type transport system ATP-binding protein